jgi:hypothetical protein
VDGHGIAQCAILLAMMIFIFLVAFIGISGLVGLALAQDVIVLKNGRQITAQSYREEGSTVKIQGLGGEFGIPKDQIQSISKAGQGERPGLNIIDLETTTRQTSQKPSLPPARDAKAPTSPAETRSAADVEEEKEYQKRLAEVTEKLEAARQDYFKATQGGGTSSNVSRDGMKAWTMDFASRIHDSQKVPGGGGLASTPPAPPYAPNYTPKEKELSDLRIKIDDLQKERDNLIQEMKSKNIPTGAL